MGTHLGVVSEIWDKGGIEKTEREKRKDGIKRMKAKKKGGVAIRST